MSFTPSDTHKTDMRPNAHGLETILLHTSILANRPGEWGKNFEVTYKATKTKTQIPRSEMRPGYRATYLRI